MKIADGQSFRKPHTRLRRPEANVRAISSRDVGFQLQSLGAVSDEDESNVDAAPQRLREISQEPAGRRCLAPVESRDEDQSQAGG